MEVISSCRWFLLTQKQCVPRKYKEELTFDNGYTFCHQLLHQDCSLISQKIEKGLGEIEEHLELASLDSRILPILLVSTATLYRTSQIMEKIGNYGYFISSSSRCLHPSREYTSAIILVSKSQSMIKDPGGSEKTSRRVDLQQEFWGMSRSSAGRYILSHNSVLSSSHSRWGQKSRLRSLKVTLRSYHWVWPHQGMVVFAFFTSQERGHLLSVTACKRQWPGEGSCQDITKEGKDSGLFGPRWLPEVHGSSDII